jgi:hypothetical protein
MSLTEYFVDRYLRVLCIGDDEDLSEEYRAYCSDSSHQANRKLIDEGKVIKREYLTRQDMEDQAKEIFAFDSREPQQSQSCLFPQKLSPEQVEGLSKLTQHSQ